MLSIFVYIWMGWFGREKTKLRNWVFFTILFKFLTLKHGQSCCHREPQRLPSVWCALTYARMAGFILQHYLFLQWWPSPLPHILCNVKKLEHDLKKCLSFIFTTPKERVQNIGHGSGVLLQRGSEGALSFLTGKDLQIISKSNALPLTALIFTSSLTVPSCDINN